MNTTTTSINADLVGQLLYGGSFAVFLILLVIFIGLTAILHYHWINYDIKISGIKTIEWLYVAVSLILFYGMGITFIFIIL